MLSQVSRGKGHTLFSIFQHHLLPLTREFQIVKDLGAVPFDYKQPIEDQAKEVMAITSNEPFRIFDAVTTGVTLAQEIYKLMPEGGDRYFSTTDDW